MRRKAPWLRTRVVRPRPIERARPASEAGYVAIDATIAMFIFASAIVFSLAAAHQALRLSRTALEIRQADMLIAKLLETYRNANGVITGRTAAFAWTVTVDPPVKSIAAASLCRHTVSLVSLGAGRAYTAQTNEVCPTGDAS